MAGAATGRATGSRGSRGLHNWRSRSRTRGDGGTRAVVELELTLLEVRASGLRVASRRTYGAGVAAGARASGELAEAWNRAFARIFSEAEKDLRRALEPSR